MALIDTTGFGQAVVAATGGNGQAPANFYGSGSSVRFVSRWLLADAAQAGLRPYCPSANILDAH